jgi:Fe2+ or Zn2+ uptake regulation protein
MREMLESIEPDCGEDDIVIFIVHGFVPEFSDNIAFRIDKSYRTRRKKDIICPHCGRVFETVDEQIRVEVFRCSKKTGVDCHKFRHCKICHRIVGIKYA